MIIDYLCRHPQYIKKTAQWTYDEFIRNTPRTADFNRVLAHFSSTSQTAFPITYIALVNQQCAGTVSIVHNDLKTQSDLTPWLAALYVSPEMRCQGIAQQLIAEACRCAEALGYKALYLRTEHTSAYYRRLDWDFVYHTTDDVGIETDIFKMML